MTDYNNFLQHLERLEEQKISYGLERVEEACRRFGNPEKRFKSVHIAGTNGKGSTAAFLESILRHNGYRVGLYTSPHLADVRERIQIDRVPISKDFITRLSDKLMRHPRESGDSASHSTLLRAQRNNLRLSYFEFLTVIAFLYFAEQQIDIAVIETGLGGRLDATNVIDPLLTILTSISIDHAKYLGSDVSAIAVEKCGIIKAGVAPPTISARQSPEVMNVIEARCRDTGSRLVTAWPLRRVYPSTSSGRTEVLTPSLKGAHQIENAALAVCAAAELGRLGYNIKFESGYLDVEWPGRLQTIHRTVISKMRAGAIQAEILLDGAHNVGACEALAEYLKAGYSGRDIAVIFSAMGDKDIAGMAAPLKEIAAGWVILPLEMPRAASMDRLVKELDLPNATVATTPDEAVSKAYEFGFKNPLIVVTGSLYLVGRFISSQ